MGMKVNLTLTRGELAFIIDAMEGALAAIDHDYESDYAEVARLIINKLEVYKDSVIG